MGNNNHNNNSQRFQQGQAQGQSQQGVSQQPPTEQSTVKTTPFKAGLYEGDEEGKIESSLQKELEAAGLKFKFIDYKQAKANGGRSRAGWIIYAGLDGNKEPVRRGTTVLAVKTDANAKKQKDRIELQRKVMNRYNNNKAEELNREAQSLGGTSRIIAGYNENG